MYGLLTLGACAAGLRYLACVCVCQSVTTLAATSFTFKQKIRYHKLLYGVFNLWILPKRLISGDMAILACLYDRGRLLLIENTPAVLDTIRTDIVCEVLATRFS